MEESQLTFGSNRTSDLGEIFSTELGMDEELSMMSTANPPMPTADLPMLTADPPMPIAEGYMLIVEGRMSIAKGHMLFAEGRTPNVDSFNLLD